MPGKANGKGGTRKFIPLSKEQLSTATFRTIIESRHSMRHFSKEHVSQDLIREAVFLAQNTPSACNRQPWRTITVSEKEKIETVLQNQNGNRGFGEEIDKLLFVVSDLQCYNKTREQFQVYIDGGMYAGVLLECLHSVGVATIPLSAALTNAQEYSIRNLIREIKDSEQLILMIGVGCYPSGSECITTMSTRYMPSV